MKKLLILVLIAVLGVGGWVWWERGMTDLVITGQATVKATPDEYVFRPNYEATDPDKTKARDAVTKTGNEIVAHLKSLGVTDSMLATDVAVNQDYSAPPSGVPIQLPSPTRYTATYTVTATITDLDLAKKVQAYLGTTPVNGRFTPTSTFQPATRTKLEHQARRLALDDAKAQADDTTSSLGVKVRGIKSLGQPGWGGPVVALGSNQETAAKTTGAAPEFSSPDLLVGKQEINYSIQVIYRVR